MTSRKVQVAATAGHAVWWRLSVTTRLAWVPTTGELYAMELSDPDQAKDPVEVLGVLWSRPQVEACLAGWSERCGDQQSLLWARDQIARWRPLVEEAQVILTPPEPAR